MCKWISVKEQLPDNSRLVLIMTRRYYGEYDVYSSDVFLAWYESDYDEETKDYYFTGKWQVKDTGTSDDDATRLTDEVYHWMDIPEHEDWY